MANSETGIGPGFGARPRCGTPYKRLVGRHITREVYTREAYNQGGIYQEGIPTMGGIPGGIPTMGGIPGRY